MEVQQPHLAGLSLSALTARRVGTVGAIDGSAKRMGLGLLARTVQGGGGHGCAWDDNRNRNRNPNYNGIHNSNRNRNRTCNGPDPTTK